MDYKKKKDLKDFSTNVIYEINLTAYASSGVFERITFKVLESKQLNLIHYVYYYVGRVICQLILQALLFFPCRFLYPILFRCCV